MKTAFTAKALTGFAAITAALSVSVFFSPFDSSDAIKNTTKHGTRLPVGALPGVNRATGAQKNEIAGPLIMDIRKYPDGLCGVDVIVRVEGEQQPVRGAGITITWSTGQELHGVDMEKYVYRHTTPMNEPRQLGCLGSAEIEVTSLPKDLVLDDKRHAISFKNTNGGTVNFVAKRKVQDADEHHSDLPTNDAASGDATATGQAEPVEAVDVMGTVGVKVMDITGDGLPLPYAGATIRFEQFTGQTTWTGGPDGTGPIELESFRNERVSESDLRTEGAMFQDIRSSALWTVVSIVNLKDADYTVVGVSQHIVSHAGDPQGGPWRSTSLVFEVKRIGDFVPAPDIEIPGLPLQVEATPTTPDSTESATVGPTPPTESEPPSGDAPTEPAETPPSTTVPAVPADPEPVPSTTVPAESEPVPSTTVPAESDSVPSSGLGEPLPPEPVPSTTVPVASEPRGGSDPNCRVGTTCTVTPPAG